MEQLDRLTADVLAAFRRLHRTVFQGDPAANPQLAVEVLDAAVVVDTPTVVLLTPWTANGLAFPPDDTFPEVVLLAGRSRPVFRIELAGLGPFRSVNLPTPTAQLRDMTQARAVIGSWTEPVRQAVRAAREAV